MRDIISDEELTNYLKLFVLLYADDTILLSENANDLQKALDGMKEYCDLNNLFVNVEKTKVVVFSKGKIRNKPVLKFGNHIIEVVDKYKYLGIEFNYNGHFAPNIKTLSTIATKAMFALLQKGRKYNLDLDTQLHLFESMVKPIMLYGSEVWGYNSVDVLERVQLIFFKILLKVHKSTP